MRITGGRLRGRTLRAPDNTATRPTTDRVREALFDILAHHDWGADIKDPLTDAFVLDAFAGSGALGFDALSRGAAHVTFFEKDRPALAALRANGAQLQVSDACTLLSCDALHPPKAPQACTLIFLDPPYRKDLIPPTLAALQRAGWIAPHALLVAETAKKEAPPAAAEWTLLLSRDYGDTTVSFLTFALADLRGASEYKSSNHYS